MQTNEQLRRWQSPAGCLELHHRSSKKHWGMSGQQEAISNAILVVQLPFYLEGAKELFEFCVVWN